MQINSGLEYVFGIPYGNSQLVIIIVVVTALFIISSVSGIAVSYTHLVMGNEIMGMTRRIMRGVEMDEDRLCRGVIDDVQPGGHYLGSLHTRYYFKDEQFWPKLMNRNRIDDWTAAGAKSLGQRTLEMTQQLLALAAPEALDADVAAQLQDIVAKAEANL